MYVCTYICCAYVRIIGTVAFSGGLLSSDHYWIIAPLNDRAPLCLLTLLSARLGNLTTSIMHVCLYAYIYCM